MTSPFPGMDPYLEDDAIWPAFHHQFVMWLYQILLPGLVDRYRARVLQRRYVVEQALFTSVVQEQHFEDYIEIRQRGDGRLVTHLDVVSPGNKMSNAGRAAYLDKRTEGRRACANLVEIDLILQGEPTLDFSREGLPNWDFAVAVTRATQPERFQIYPTTLRKQLPRFRLPLAADDRDIHLDLQTAFERCFEQGGFAARIEYHGAPPMRLNDADSAWMDELLKQKKCR